MQPQSVPIILKIAARCSLSYRLIDKIFCDAFVAVYFYSMNNKTTDRLYFERKLWAERFERVMGVDEVGRGCLAGPVVAAGVVFSSGESIPEIKDSKQLNEKERNELATIIREKAVYCTIQQCSPAEIDRMNILWASVKAMQKCAEADGANPDYLLVDGNRFTASLIPYTCVVKGDDRSQSIAAASILAKVYRDELMKKLHTEYPFYGWDTNVGYPTKTHYAGLKEKGYTRYHRKSFKLKTAKEFNIG